MKYNSKKFLALLLSVTMAAAPVSVYAEDISVPMQTEGLTEAVTEAISEDMTEAAAEVETETVTEKATETVTETATEEATETVTETATEAVTENVTETETEVQTEFTGETLVSEETEEKLEAAVYAAAENTTAPVDNSTTLADGEYVPTAFTGVKASDRTEPKAKITCEKVIVKDGKAVAAISIASTNYSYVKANAQQYTTTITDSASVVEIPVDLNVENTIYGYSTSMAREIGYIINVTLSESETETEAESAAETEKTVEDGTYTGAVTTTGKMFSVVACEVTVSDGKATALITLSGTGYNRVYMGTAEAASADEEGWIAPVDEVGVTYTSADGEVKTGLQFVIPVSAFDTDLAMAVRSASKGTWGDKTVNFAAPDVEETESETEEAETESESEDKTVADGTYTGAVTTTGKMFSVVASEVTVSEGKAAALITLSGTGYDRVYMGTAEAAAADEEGWIAPVDEVGVEYTNADGEVKTGLQFVIPVSAFDTDLAMAVRSASKGTWGDKTVNFSSSELKEIGGSETETESESESESEVQSETETEAGSIVPDDSTTAVDNNTTLADGTYAPESFTFVGGSGKTKIYCDSITVKDGKAYATIRFSSSSYDYVKASAGKYFNLTPGEKSTFEIPVALNTDNTVIGNTTAMSTPKEIAYTIHPVLSETAETAPETEAETETEIESETEAGVTVDPDNLKDGTYTCEVTVEGTMFRVVANEVTVTDGKITALITLSGTGYNRLYIGSAEHAAADSSAWIAAKDSVEYTDKDGTVKTGYRFEIPVEALDTAIEVAAYAAKTGEWKPRTITFNSAGMKILGEAEETETETETETELSTEPDKESSYESDLSGGTSAVDSSTTLKDGVYTPDKFSWSGGSGRTSISCSKITVTNGQAYATIVFGSSSFEYVKANGNKYFGTKGGGTTTFVIPVKLNANNTIIGMTTAMSTAHEVTYNIYVYLEAANTSGKSGTEGEAPEILGLDYESETKLEYADYLRIYNYSDGITLLEIDMVSDTQRDPELAEDEAAEEVSETEPETEEAVVSEEGEEVVQTADEITAELYLADTVKYLVVPEDVEVPVGLEKEMIIVTVPAKSSYIASEEAMLAMEKLGLTDLVTLSGFEAEDCPSESVRTAMEEEKTAFAGTYEEPVFRELVLGGCDLAIFPDEILIKDEETVEEDMERFEQITSGFGTLGVPMIVDRSADEESELAKAEWIKAYGVLFGCEELAEELYSEVADAQ